MCIKVAKYITCFITVFLLFSAVNIQQVKAEKQDSEIYNLDKDGYWKPKDNIAHDFYIENIWGETCYLESISFRRISIKDVGSDKSYNIDEAISSGIIDDAYNITINEGENLLYSGDISDLVSKEHIPLKEPIFLELDTKIKFTISIYFDPLAGNEYQNKKYEYLLYPEAFKVEEVFKPEISLPQTGSVISSFTIGIVGICLIILGLLISLRNKRKEVR